MVNEIQKILLSLGENGCYFLSILKAANFNGDVVTAYSNCLKEHLIEPDCFVLDPVGIYNKFAPEKVSKIEKSNSIYNSPKVVIAQFENGCYRHFVLIKSPTYSEYHLWDSLGNSNTVKNGHIHSYRLFW